MRLITKSALATALVAAFSVTAFAANTITVSGNGEVKADADTAILQIGVTTQAKSVSEAQATNAKNIAKVREALFTKQLGKQDVKSTNYTVSPVYEYPQNAKPVVVGYSVNHTMQVRVKNLDQVGAILDVAGQAGATELGNVMYTTSHKKELELEALTLAYKDALSRADALAKASGRSLKGAVHVTTSSTNYQPIYKSSRMGDSAAGQPLPAPTEINQGQLTISATVTVDFEF